MQLKIKERLMIPVRTQIIEMVQLKKTLAKDGSKRILPRRSYAVNGSGVIFVAAVRLAVGNKHLQTD